MCFACYWPSRSARSRQMPFVCDRTHRNAITIFVSADMTACAIVRASVSVRDDIDRQRRGCRRTKNHLDFGMKDERTHIRRNELAIFSIFSVKWGQHTPTFFVLCVHKRLRLFLCPFHTNFSLLGFSFGQLVFPWFLSPVVRRLSTVGRSNRVLYCQLYHCHAMCASHARTHILLRVDHDTPKWAVCDERRWPNTIAYAARMRRCVEQRKCAKIWYLLSISVLRRRKLN